MNISHSVPSLVSSISFSFLTTEDIRRISVKQIVNPILLDDLNRPNAGALYDPALGPSDPKDICSTCRLTYYTCPGHFGHIELPSPVFHPLFMTNMFKLLRATCLFCHHFKMSRSVIIKYITKLRLLEHGLLDAAKGVDEIQMRMKKSDGEEEGEDVTDEQMGEFEARMNLYVYWHLQHSASPHSGYANDDFVYQTRKDLMAEFLKNTMLKKCQNVNCCAHSFSLKKEGHTKVIEYDLTVKQKLQHDAMSLVRPSVLLSQANFQSVHSSPLSTTIEESDESDSASDSSSNIQSPQLPPPVSEASMDTLPREQVHDLPKAANGRVKTMRGRGERVMPPEECRAHLRLLFSNEKVMCSLVFGRHGPFAFVSSDGLTSASADMFFMEVLCVAPTRFRPPAKMAETLFEHPQNELLARVLNTSYRLRESNDELKVTSAKGLTQDEAMRTRLMGSLLDGLIQLQVDVNSFIDSGKNPAPMRQGKLPPAGVKQGLEKKEGLFRMNMMGKRVNHSARSVISPDVNIEPNEIGIPPVFARKLAFPEPVTVHNVHELRQYVINGPFEYPGASMVEDEDGTLHYLEKLPSDRRKALANQLLTDHDDTHAVKTIHGLSSRTRGFNKKVYRHLRDGDLLILNRQPTLHKPSMMAHKARVLQGEKTIRMHYANCNSYNADFDGDEMNIHFPQNQVARAEAMLIANTDNQYLVPTSGKPLRGLIQDHVVGGVWMTNRETFFDRGEYFQLLYGALKPERDSYNGRLKTLPPTIWKPKALWTGKQIISTILLNITPETAKGLNMDSKAKVSADLWGKGSEEGKVIIMDGELLCGILDKSQFGASDFGLVHSVYELYGADVAGQLLGIFSRLFTKFLQHRAFTCRMDDLVLTPDGNEIRSELLQKGASLGTEGAMENFPSLANVPLVEKQGALISFMQEVLRDDNKMAGLDVTVKMKLAKLTTSIADSCMPHGLFRKFPHNHMQMMTQSGAKGSAVNAQQISCALGQQELEGRRVPVMVSGKTLPSFQAFETAAMAGGYVASRFLTGVKPQEFYFHCMAGREGLIDTAVKTSRSGYLQRCLIKHLEGVRVHYDHTVRNSDNSVYQFHYGGDSLDVTKQKHLYQFEFTGRNMVSLLNRYRPKRIAGVVDDETALLYMKKAIKSLAKQSHRSHSNDVPTTALSLYSPSRFLGATSEKFAERVHQYTKCNPDNLLKSKGSKPAPWLGPRHSPIPSSRFQLLMNVRYMRSLIDPGEAVGLLAAQGVGEPSTQMTLNTFHFAGHGAANVTLGIPRLREIVMTASAKPKTPSMTLIVRPGALSETIQTFCKQATRLPLSHIVDRVTVEERLLPTRRKQFSVNISFYPMTECKEEHDITSSEILSTFGSTFPLILKKETQTELRKLETETKNQLSDVGKGRAVRQPDAVADDDDGEPASRADDDRSEVGDDDADHAKRMKQSKQQATYESDDDDNEQSLAAFDDIAIEAEFDSDPDEDPIMDDDVSEEVNEDDISVKVEEVRELFMRNFTPATAFDFSDSGVLFELEFEPETPKLLLVDIVERACEKAVIREIHGLTDCFQVKDDKSQDIKLVTNGSNLPGMWRFAHGKDIIEENNIYTNDIYAALQTYGVEMARAIILKEIKGVFGAYNIDVDIRHLELIADYMTFDGGYKAFNRKGISTYSSALLKASYETTGAFLSDAALHGDVDDLKTPSSNIVLGQPNLSGTGIFDVVQPVV